MLLLKYTVLFGGVGESEVGGGGHFKILITILCTLPVSEVFFLKNDLVIGLVCISLFLRKIITNE